jgi:hypothetical protein
VVSEWATAAFDRAAPPGARLLYAGIADRHVPRWAWLDEQFGVYLPGYPVTTPDDRLAVDLVLDPGTAARKTSALAAQATQTADLIAALGVDRYTAWVGQEWFVDRVHHPGAAPQPQAVLTAQ